MKKFILSLISIFIIGFGVIFIYNSLQIINKDNKILNTLNDKNMSVETFSPSNLNFPNDSNGAISSFLSSLFGSNSNDGNVSQNSNNSSQNTSSNTSTSNSNPNGKLSLPQGNVDVNGISLVNTLQGNEAINKAAHKITASYSTSIDKAKALYVWIAANITYNNTYAKELTKGIYPPNIGTAIDTFNSRNGVCSGFAALYFLMAKDVGLNVKLISGQGLGDPATNTWGSHMWNEVYINNTWIPVDTTFANSYTVAMNKINATPQLKGYLTNENTTINKVNGFNIETYTVPSADFFNPPNFYKTHKNSQTLATWIN
ncbi:MAG: transglutaminase domain-containing protein [Clostridium sp.]|uniref:transglutaminase domain-containing protein n=1 Tax=Clostridium sp. TaxID=1506 RepID=UPI003F40EDD6